MALRLLVLGLFGCSAASAQTVSFERVQTDPGLGRLDFVVAVADLNGDGRDDIIAGGREEHRLDGEPEDRFVKAPLRVFLGGEDGGVAHAPQLVEGSLEARFPVVVTADLNGDERLDLAVFDAGVYVGGEVSLGYGNPPQLFLSSPAGRLQSSDALADAVRREHELWPHPHYSEPADLHLKSATSGDIDNDGDVDLWVDSIGGANVVSHFMMNNGDGTFTVDVDAAPFDLRHNTPGEWWYHLHGHLVDLDADGDLDLALAQNRGDDPTSVNQSSIVLVNDGTGYFPTRIKLPLVDFHNGFTTTSGQTHSDVNGDGLQDLLLAHTRNDDSQSDVLPFTGRYVQVLVNDGESAFVDETSTRMGDQSAVTAEYDSEGVPLHNEAALSMHDVDRDGCADLFASRSWGWVRPESPLVYRNNGSGQFEAMAPEPFADLPQQAVPAGVNGDGVIDFVAPDRHEGPDGEWGSEDDFTVLVVLVNTTPPGPARCRKEAAAGVRESAASAPSMRST